MGLALLTNEIIDKLGLTVGQTLVNSKGKMPPSCPIEGRNLCKDACERWIRNQDHYSGTSGIKINPIELPAEVETDVEAKTPSRLDASEFDEVSISSVDTIESLKSSVEEDQNVSPTDEKETSRSCLRLQNICDRLLDPTDVRVGISHKLIYDKEKQWRVACAYCKDTVILGSASQGVSNFKRHTETKSHKNKRSA